jgi:hypothetical protein
MDEFGFQRAEAALHSLVFGDRRQSPAHALAAELVGYQLTAERMREAFPVYLQTGE